MTAATTAAACITTARISVAGVSAAWVGGRIAAHERRQGQEGHGTRDPDSHGSLLIKMLDEPLNASAN
jgi:hypothetical protein